MDAAEHALRKRNFRTVFALAALFLLPLIASFWLYYGLHWHPHAMTNHGALIQPVRTLPQVPLEQLDGRSASAVFTGHWTLVYIGSAACDDACRRALFFMRQTRLSLNNQMTRVQRVFLTTGGGTCDCAFLAAQHPGLLLIDAATPPAQPLLARFPADQRANTLFIVDPLGNLMMRYDVRLAPEGLLDDLKKLLQLSHIG